VCGPLQQLQRPGPGSTHLVFLLYGLTTCTSSPRLCKPALCDLALPFPAAIGRFDWEAPRNIERPRSVSFSWTYTFEEASPQQFNISGATSTQRLYDNHDLSHLFVRVINYNRLLKPPCPIWYRCMLHAQEGLFICLGTRRSLLANGMPIIDLVISRWPTTIRCAHSSSVVCGDHRDTSCEPSEALDCPVSYNRIHK
jgi:hypothetical protein